MKKQSFLTLAIAVLIATFIPIQSSANNDIEQYVPRIKQIFDIGSDYDNFDIFTNDFNGKDTYNLSWMNDSDNIDVGIDVDGNIISYSKYDYNSQEEHSKFPKITKEQALNTAKEIIGKIDPNLLKNIKHNDEMNVNCLLCLIIF